MKRFYMLILAILATGSLSGCGSKPDSGGSDQNPDSYDKYEFKRVTSLDEISGDENDEYCLITRGKTTYVKKHHIILVNITIWSSPITGSHTQFHTMVMEI